MTQVEYVLWGKPAGQTDALYEEPLTTRQSRAECDYVATVAAKEGWHGFRIQVLDYTTPLDFAGALNVR